MGYHNKNLMGLARTIRKETIVITGAAKTPQFKATFNGVPADRIEFTQQQIQVAKRTGETSITHQIRFENRSKEPLKFSGDKLDEPFRVDSRPSTIKSKDIRFDWTAFFDSLIESSSSIS